MGLIPSPAFHQQFAQIFYLGSMKQDMMKDHHIIYHEISIL
ncbi:unnamed protein product [Paramecium octaurelia]|uniref:Uncharacterized protein n=1 Tax=Paramecium octaurelia TaxID=43137 RepID=A0A8S1TJE6_PAROT|nr:unnamed protein product [Paramecium octaurelia]